VPKVRTAHIRDTLGEVSDGHSNLDKVTRLAKGNHIYVPIIEKRGNTFIYADVRTAKVDTIMRK